MALPPFRAVLVVLVAASASGSASHATPAAAPSATTRDDAILLLVNQHRANARKPPLLKSETMWEQANAHSCNMASGAVPFGHGGFKARAAVIRAALGGGGPAAENVAMGQRSPAAVVGGWLGSASHRANIEGNYTRTGISAVTAGGGVWYYTQMFY